ncbi:MAG: DUF922 domain-containing protein [Chitinophagaceae bacterium]|nr:DUF922 domain-containing protein [Chitinophagaceae bacterium]
MPLFHLIILVIFFLTFSGTPRPKIVTALPVVKPHIQQLFDKDEQQIPWAPDRKLTWEDFQCEPKHNTDAVASTSTSLGIAYQIKNSNLVYQINCSFSKAKSWGLVKTPYILTHEQGHFDITELFARKLHKALKEYILNRATFQKDINRIYEQIIEEKEAFQAAYDGETDHSRSRQAQLEWLEKIDELLAQTEPYADYPSVY